MRPKYTGQVIEQNTWWDNEKTKTEGLGVITMEATTCGHYYFSAKKKVYDPTNHMDNFRSAVWDFREVVIEGDTISFYRMLSEHSPRHPRTPRLVIKFNKGEVARLLEEDAWFKSQHWFKVTIIKQCQLSVSTGNGMTFMQPHEDYDGVIWSNTTPECKQQFMETWRNAFDMLNSDFHENAGADLYGLLEDVGTLINKGTAGTFDQLYELAVQETLRMLKVN